MSGKTQTIKLVKLSGNYVGDYDWIETVVDFIQPEVVSDSEYFELCEWVSVYNRKHGGGDLYAIVVVTDEEDKSLLKMTHKEFLDRERKKREAEEKKQAADKAKRDAKALEVKRKKLEKLKAELEGAS